MELSIGHATDHGHARSNNEDSFLVDDAHSLFAVADGMGGHRGGEVASNTAIGALRDAFAAGAPLDHAIVDANAAVFARAAGHAELEGMGTTLTAVTIAGPSQLLVGHVGDSRAYLLHDGELRRVTDDHSLVEELVREGRLTPEQAETHPQRAIVTRALGVDPEVEVDVYPVEVANGDRVVLCSDGLTTMVRDRDVEHIAATEPDPQRAADLMVAAANDAGGDDNITVLIIDVRDVVSDGAATAAVPAAARENARDDTLAEAVVPPVVPPDDGARSSQQPRERGSRTRTARGVVLVLIPILLVLGIGAAVLGIYARHSYFVGLAGQQVVIYKGVPGGVLGWNPTVERRTAIQVDQLPEVERDRVRTNSTRGSLGTAEAFVEHLRSTATTSTTVPATSTTVKKKPKPKTKTTTTVKRPRTTTTVGRRP